MQSTRTIEFWDNFYLGLQDEDDDDDDDDKHQKNTHEFAKTTNNHKNKEWILEPCPKLLDEIVSYLCSSYNCDPFASSSNKICRILEIGCGNSCLAIELWKHILQMQQEQQQQQQQEQLDDDDDNNNKNKQQLLLLPKKIQFLATDVSEICIQQVQQRDAEYLGNAIDHDDDQQYFQYSVLNITESHPEFKESFDLILDKGCLDTFLFRTKHRGGQQRPEAPLIQTVLDNIQSWLRRPPGTYLILSPRTKHKSARDYLGFSSVHRYPVDLSQITKGVVKIGGSVEHRKKLLATNHQTKKKKTVLEDRVFVYACRKNIHYQPGIIIITATGASSYSSSSFATAHEPNAPPKDTDTCPGCAITFYQFRKTETNIGRGELFWHRHWRGHCKHCKGGEKQKKSS